MSVTNITIAGTTIGTWARNSRILTYLSGARRGRNFTIPYREGEYSDPLKWYSPTDILLEVSFKWQPSVEQNMSGLIETLAPSHSLVTITGRTVFHSTVRAQVELLGPPSPHAQDPTTYIFQLRNPRGYWEDVTATTSAGDPPTISTNGDRPIDDMVFTFATTGNVSHTDSLGNVSTLTLTTGAAANSVVDVGNRTVQTATGGNQDNRLTVTQPYWMRWEPGSTQAITSTGLTKVVWRNKWAL